MRTITNEELQKIGRLTLQLQELKLRWFSWVEQQQGLTFSPAEWPLLDEYSAKRDEVTAFLGQFLPDLSDGGQTAGGDRQAAKQSEDRK